MSKAILKLSGIRAFEFFTALFVFAIFFQDLLISVFNSKVFKSLDEISILLILAVLVVDMLFRNKVNLFYLSLTSVFIYFIFISIVFGKHHTLIDILLQTIIHLKFFIYFSFFYYYSKNGSKINLLSILKYIVYFSLVGLLLELLFRNSFYDFMQIEEYLRPYAKKGKVIYGGFIKANLLSFLFLIYFAIKSNFGALISNKKYWIWFSLIFIFFIAVKSRTALIMLFILPFVKFKRIIFQPKYMIAAFIGVVLSLIVVYYKTNFIEKTIQNLSLFFTLDSYYIRGIMYCLSGKIFIDFFPIGTGAATFGTVLSEGSVVYEMYHVAHRYFFINMDGVYDSNFASIVGEFGFIGVLLFLSLFFMMKKFPAEVYHKNLFITLNWITIFYCLTTPLFMNSFFALVLAFGYAHVHNIKTITP
ncbi:hypothetical protein [Formosa sp. S-31]|uniref:hypothetical protein n=1 Tax=Formosa sp. S-31 TaxID=2790949 RepID=UPI003EBC6953